MKNDYKYSLEDDFPYERAVDLVKKYMELDFSTNYSDFDNVDCNVYNESTADGYDVYVVTNNTRSVSICEDVYYYDHDIQTAVREQIRYGDKTFFIDEDLYEDAYIDDMLCELFADYVEDILLEAEELGITDDEVKHLKVFYDLNEEEVVQFSYPRFIARTHKVRAFRGMRTFDKYKANLREHNGDIWSYSTKVAEIKDGKLHQLGWWSVTTQKHINYAAKELGLELIK